MSKNRRYNLLPHERPFEQQRVAEPSRETAAVAVMEPPPEIPTPEPVRVEDPNVFDLAEYKALVAELGVNDSAVRNAELRQFFADEGITVYPYEKVTAFMDAKLEREKKAASNPNLDWRWKPLMVGAPTVSKVPGIPAVNWSLLNVDSIRSLVFGVDAPRADIPTFKTYARAIPHAVLLTVKKLRDRFNGQVNFYASDYEVRNPDPFLMVTGPGLDYYVIERWDEPGFRA